MLLLVDHSEYVPENARICTNHVGLNDWSSLCDNGETNLYQINSKTSSTCYEMRIKIKLLWILII